MNFFATTLDVRTRRYYLSTLVTVFLAGIAYFPIPGQAELRLARIFGDHMILQRQTQVTIWGWARKDESIEINFAGQTVATTAAEDGSWNAIFRPLKANAAGRELRVRSGDESVSVQDVVVGDIWHASGQSNMAMTVGAVAKRLSEAEQDIKTANLPAIRFRRINEGESVVPLNDLRTAAQWQPCAPETARGFSAAAFYFARKLHAEISVPIGIIDSSRGGTPIEPFIPRDAFKSHPTLLRELELGDKGDLQGIWKLPGGVRARDVNWLPGRLFHSRLAPISRFAVTGAIWYQGESNCGDGEDPRDYQHKMRALINGWRKELGNDKMPVYFVQLPGSGARDGWPYLREQQRLSSDLPGTGMAVTIDLFDQDIHPPNKFDVGQRLARWALADKYRKQIPFSGPLFQRAEIVDDQVTVHFSHAAGGLMIAMKDGLAEPVATPKAKLAHFQLADEQGDWFPAQATITDRTVVVRSKSVKKPVAVRYAYAVNPEGCNLYNGDGLPASPFCSDAKLLNYQPKLPSD